MATTSGHQQHLFINVSGNKYIIIILTFIIIITFLIITITISFSFCLCVLHVAMLRTNYTLLVRLVPSSPDMRKIILITSLHLNKIRIGNKVNISIYAIQFLYQSASKPGLGSLAILDGLSTYTYILRSIVILKSIYINKVTVCLFVCVSPLFIYKKANKCSKIDIPFVSSQQPINASLI